MKKLFAVLFCALVMVGAAFADDSSYEIDPVATAKAPWRVGEKIVKEGYCDDTKYYREFLGVTQSGLAVVQEFYLSGEKRTSPFSMNIIGADKNAGYFCEHPIEGSYILWYESGEKWSEMNYKNDRVEGPVTAWYRNGQKMQEINLKNGDLEGLWTDWYENGQKKKEGNFKNRKMVDIWREWDEKGNLIREEDFGEPKE